MNSVAIDVQQVSKSFRLSAGKNTTIKERILRVARSNSEEFVALDNVSLFIERGSTVGLIGVNGSGKSTLLKLISRIIYPDRGKVNVYGSVSSLLELGAGFHPDFTGVENVYMNAALLGVTKKQVESRIDQIIDFAGLGDFVYQPVRGYSSGMYMRLAFSVATMIDPDILLIDEVLAVGDAAFQAKCFTRLRELKDQGKTIVLVTHDLNSVERFCDRVVWLEEGKVKADGKPREVGKAYLAKSFLENQAVKTQLEIKPVGNTSALGERWGDGTIRIKRVTIGTTQAGGLHISGYPFKIVIAFEVASEFPTDKRVMFGMNICDSEGRSVYGTNTSIDGYSVPEIIEKKGEITFECDRLPLLEGVFSFDASVYNIDGTPYDHWLNCAKFTVVNPDPEVGAFRIEHKWHFSQEGSV